MPLLHKDYVFAFEMACPSQVKIVEFYPSLQGKGLIRQSECSLEPELQDDILRVYHSSKPAKWPALACLEEADQALIRGWIDEKSISREVALEVLRIALVGMNAYKYHHFHSLSSMLKMSPLFHKMCEKGLEVLGIERIKGYKGVIRRGRVHEEQAFFVGPRGGKYRLSSTGRSRIYV